MVNKYLSERCLWISLVLSSVRPKYPGIKECFQLRINCACLPAHSSILAWRIPGTEEPGGLLSIELHRVGHDWSDLAAAAAAAAAVPVYMIVKCNGNSCIVSPYIFLNNCRHCRFKLFLSLTYIWRWILIT